MDHRQEQEDEMEALLSIFPDEFEKVSENPATFKITIAGELKPEEGEDWEEGTFALLIKYTATYPEELPIYDLVDADAVTEEELEKCKESLAEAAEESLGMPMVFNLHAAALEWLQDNNEARQKDNEERKEAERQRLLQEEIEQTIKGTTITTEIFEEWKVGFMKELAEKEAKQVTSSAAKKNKLTGKQMFLTNKNMLTSEDSVTQEGEVAIDETLFEGLDLADEMGDIDFGEEDEEN